MTTPLKELEGTWEEIAAHAAELAGHRVRLTILQEEPSSAPSSRPHSRVPTAGELLRLSPGERRALQAHSAKAETIYREERDLTAFEAFGERDLYDETPQG